MSETTDPRSFEGPAEAFSLFRVPQKRRVILCLLLALGTIVLYNPVTRAPFLNYDDSINVTENSEIRAGLTWHTIVWAFQISKGPDWRPITSLSYALDCQMFGLNPAGFHTINVLFHAADAVLLFLILESATGLVWRSVAVAALFALHPINVESVAWISEQKNVISMFFFLIALAAYGWYARRPSVGRYSAVTIAYALGLMSKPQVITFPFALLLLDYWPLCRLSCPEGIAGEPAGAAVGNISFRKLIWEKVPWFLMSAVAGIITMKGGKAFNYVVETHGPGSTFPLWIRMGNAAISYVRYLGNAFWPANLPLVYPHPGYGISSLAIELSVFALIGVTIVVLIFRRRRPFLVGWLWFLGTMFPMSGLVFIGPHAMADRYAYIPLLGIFVMVCWGAADLIEGWHIPAAVSLPLGVGILLMLGIGLHRQVSFWNNNVTLWTHTLAITEGNFPAEENLALALIAENRVQEALLHLERASALRPNDPLATFNIATYEQMHGNYQAALNGYVKVIQFPLTASTLRAKAEANSGYAHLSVKQYGPAQQDFEAALRDEPGNSAAYRGLGLLAQRSGDVSRATDDYERSVELQPSPVGYLLLAQALALGRHDEAARAAESTAARMSQDLNEDAAIARQLLAN
jgi:Tfp pilus assembly protein PilF